METDQKIAEIVKKTCKSGYEICVEMGTQKAHLLHMALGVCGEAGELADAIKKYCIYCKSLDIENVVEELGDLEYFMEGLRSSLRITREQTINHVFNKLNKRYQNGYSDKAAIERADKVKEQPKP